MLLWALWLAHHLVGWLRVPICSFEDFSKVDLRVAKIIAATPWRARASYCACASAWAARNARSSRGLPSGSGSRSRPVLRLTPDRFAVSLAALASGALYLGLM